MTEQGHTRDMVDSHGPHGGRRDSRQPVTITDIGTSRPAEIRARERRYVFYMLIRVVCFIAATLIFHGAARWIAIAVAIAMPWIAVVAANAPAAVRSSDYARFVPAAARGAHKLEKARDQRVIDVDLDDIQPARQVESGEPPRG